LWQYSRSGSPPSVSSWSSRWSAGRPLACLSRRTIEAQRRRSGLRRKGQRRPHSSGGTAAACDLTRNCARQFCVERHSARSIAIRHLGNVTTRRHQQRRSGCRDGISIAGLPSGTDPGVIGLPLVHLAASRAAQRHGHAREALEQNPFRLEAGRDRCARAWTGNENISQSRAPRLIGDARMKQ
jgi:hypothetical protein